MSKLSESTSETPSNLARHDLIGNGDRTGDERTGNNQTTGDPLERDSDSASTVSSSEFSAAHRRLLLDIAHEAILSAVEHRPAIEISALPADFAEPRGVFTTIYLCRPNPPHHDFQDDDFPDGDLPEHDPGGGNTSYSRQLRGCVGFALPVAPLYRAVAETARAAAFEDTRFLPVTLEEARRLQVSLSVLSRLVPILPEEVRVGLHGLLVSSGIRRGLLLPQVPVEHGWGRETFLDQTCRKAGLPLDAWRKGATIEAFTAEVFSDFDLEA